MKQFLENLPMELQGLQRFTPVLENKKPAYPAGVSWNDSANWWEMGEVKIPKVGKNYKIEKPVTADWLKWNGAVDFVLSGSNYVVLDFDHVLDKVTGKFETQEVSKLYEEIKIKVGKTYTEKSMSGTGLHILLKATDNLFAVKGAMVKFDNGGHLEIWHKAGKKFTLTGDVMDCELCQPIVGGKNVDELVMWLLSKVSSNLQTAQNLQNGNFVFSEQERALKMLEYIEPTKLNYDEWLRVGMALKNVGCNLSDWEAWSRGDSRYKVGECERKWASFNRTGVTMGTLYKMAEEGGYIEKDFFVLEKFAKRAENLQNGNSEFFSEENAKDIEEYFESGQLEKDVSYFQKYRERGTGYKNLDENCKLYPGLYVIGAVSSLGKTTFMHQMADQLSQNGERVIYVSYEQSRFELISKGLSRLTYLHSEKKYGVSSLQIRSGAQGESIKSAVSEYKKFGKNELIVEADFDYTIEKIVELVKLDIAKGKYPVLIVDYLQVIAPAKDKLGRTPNTKEHIDEVVKRLKSLQREYGLVVFLISSLNRQNYLTQIDFESFKESGGIEYTADVVFGMQLAVMKSDIFKKDASLNEKREAVKKAKGENPRKIELVCLKNRYAAPGYSCYFKYYAKYDLFEVDVESDKTEKIRKKLVV